MSIKGISQKVLLVILDGFGLSAPSPFNAVENAKKPNINNLFNNFPMTKIDSMGISVGLPKGVVGNSEVGHMNIGAGRPVRQDLVRINEAITNESLASMPKLIELINFAKANSNRVHLLGLLSDGGVHSHIDHLKEIIKILASHGIKVFLHAFMDGRDTAPDVGHRYISMMKNVSGFTFASMQGRAIGMDRDRRWEKVERAYKMLIGKGEKSALSPEDYIQSEYKKKINDEFITPALFHDDYAIKKNDAIFFFNYRPDRAIQLALTFNDPKFKEFPVEFKAAYYLCMTPYIPDEVALPILFDKEMIPGGLCEYLSSLGLKQFKVAETEKFAHITYFFNGGKKDPFKNEDRILIPSPKEVETYDQKPEMSAYPVTEKLLEALDKNEHDFYLVNFANADMVGHTGNYQAALKAVEAVDNCIGKIAAICEKRGIAMALTADHGNCDTMAYEDGSPHTSHTGPWVPFLVVHNTLKGKKLEATSKELALKDIAPTVLHIMGKTNPPLFEGKTIFN